MGGVECGRSKGRDAMRIGRDDVDFIFFVRSLFLFLIHGPIPVAR